MIVVTWNVLHRVHAVNWDEPAIKTWADERDRIASIADFIGELEADVLCLQEVSGDQLAMLRDVERGTVFATPYPRVPAYHRRFEPATLKDPREHLVTIVRGDGASLVGGTAFASDPGKGFQEVELDDGTRVVVTHVSFGAKGADQCATIAGIDRGDAPLIVAGDFNAERDACLAWLGPSLVAAVPHAPALPTRPRPATGDRDQDIDHVFVRGLVVGAAEVLDGYGRSDHNPVAARLSPVN